MTTEIQPQSEIIYFFQIWLKPLVPYSIFARKAYHNNTGTVALRKKNLARLSPEVYLII